MSRPNIHGGRIDGAVRGQALDRTPGKILLGGDLTLTTKSEPVQVLDPSGTHRDVTLPAEADSQHLQFLILNEASSTEDLIVKNDSGTVLDTLAGFAAASTKSRGLFVCDGVAWYSMHTIQKA